MPSLEFEVYCDTCGVGLCLQTTVDVRYGISISVGACEKCMETARQEGYDKGYEDAEEENED